MPLPPPSGKPEAPHVLFPQPHPHKTPPATSPCGLKLYVLVRSGKVLSISTPRNGINKPDWRPAGDMVGGLLWGCGRGQGMRGASGRGPMGRAVDWAHSWAFTTGQRPYPCRSGTRQETRLPPRAALSILNGSQHQYTTCTSRATCVPSASISVATRTATT